MKKEIPPEIKPILSEVKKRLYKVYRENLRKVILYGSYARGDYEEGSDIDVLLVLGEMRNISEEQKKYIAQICEIDLLYDTLISIIPMCEKDYLQRKSPLLLNVREEGIAI
jgi:predicted nucleotidyltransferase